MRNFSCRYISLIFFLCLFAQLVPARAQQPAAAASESSFSEADSLEGLALQILQQAEKVGCVTGDCRVLVTDFVFPNGQTSPFGMQLANALSAQLSKGEKPLAVVDRSQFRSFLQRGRLSPQLQNEVSAARWLAKELNANFVVVGETRRKGENEIELKGRFLSVKDKKRKVLSIGSTLRIDNSLVDLSATDALPPLPPLSETSTGEKIYRAGVQGAGQPVCSSMPNPPASEEARIAQFTGRVLAEGVIGTSGRLEALRLVNGAPYGLNEATLKAMDTWKCKPATLNGKPIPTLVTFEVNFRTY